MDPRDLIHARLFCQAGRAATGDLDLEFDDQAIEKISGIIDSLRHELFEEHRDEWTDRAYRFFWQACRNAKRRGSPVVTAADVPPFSPTPAC